MSSGYFDLVPFFSMMEVILSPVASFTLGTACWSLSKMPISEVVLPSFAYFKIKDSTLSLSVSDQPGGASKTGLVDPLCPFPLLCILAIMSVAPGLADLLHLFNRYAANYSLCRALASAPGDFGHSHAGAMALAEPINFPS